MACRNNLSETFQAHHLPLDNVRDKFSKKALIILFKETGFPAAMRNVINPFREGGNKSLSAQPFNASGKEIVCKLVAPDIGFPDNTNQWPGFAPVNFYFCKCVSGSSGRSN